MPPIPVSSEKIRLSFRNVHESEDYQPLVVPATEPQHLGSHCNHHAQIVVNLDVINPQMNHIGFQKC